MISMKFKKIIFASLIYAIWSVLIGYLVPPLAIWASVIAAVVAGIYVGRKNSVSNAILSGALAGLIGGIVYSFVTVYTTSLYGIPLDVPTAGWLTPLLEPFKSYYAYFAIPTLSLIGLFFGSIGGLFGSIAKLRKIFLFLTLFTLFIFYAALDNVAWWWGRADVKWSMSVVLTHWIDIYMAFAFALFVTVLAYCLKIY
jgi:hypothetical protein